MTLGGKREGAGRPKGSVSETTRIAIALREKLAKTVELRWKELERATFDLALGHYVEKTDENGSTIVYKKSPDITAIKYIKDQVMGKAKETLDVTDTQGNTKLEELSDTINDWINNAKRNNSRGKRDST